MSTNPTSRRRANLESPRPFEADASRREVALLIADETYET
jgi:hypothetical protein